MTFAVELYGTAIERAYALANADESAGRERAAVHRFADRTGLVALRDAVGAFLDGTELDEAVRARVMEERSVTDDLDWSPEDGAPGLWCTDIVSGTERYVEFAAEATAGLPRWTVWPASTPPGCANNSTCQATSPAEAWP
jgi:hypothetical protein